MQRQLSDWLQSYVQFTQNSESPTQYHLWSGIMAIASCLQRKTWTNWGLRGNVYPNLYTALVGPPGGRKGTAMKIAKSFLHDLEVNIGSDSLGSTQALYRELMDSTQNFRFDGKVLEHKSLSVWSEEFQVFLSDKDPRLIGSITDLFDAPDKWRYATLGRGTEDISNCWLNIIGAITPSLLQTKLSQDAVGGGLISRILFIVGYGKIKKISLPFLSKEEEETKIKLLQDLQQIKNLEGPFVPTERFIDAYVQWYESPASDVGVSSDKFVGYNSRRPLHLQKLCMIMSASESNDMKLKHNHFKLAKAVLEYTEQDMSNAFYGLGRGLHSDILADLMRYLQDKADIQGSISYTDILRRFQLDATPVELDSLLRTCELTGMIKRVSGASGKIHYEVLETIDGKQDNEYLNLTVFSGLDG